VSIVFSGSFSTIFLTLRLCSCPFLMLRYFPLAFEKANEWFIRHLVCSCVWFICHLVRSCVECRSKKLTNGSFVIGVFLCMVHLSYGAFLCRVSLIGLRTFRSFFTCYDL
jgi:hypothetical protein